VLSTTAKRLIDERYPEVPGVEEHRLFLGVCSNYLCDINVGAEVQVSGPNGKRFVLPDDREAHDYLFVATGTGIAPFRGMVLELLEGPNGPGSSRIDLVMGAPYTTDLVYDDLFRRLEREHEGFTYHTAISREMREGGRRGLYVDRYIVEEIDRFRDLLAGSRTLIYVCGLLGMQWGLYGMLVGHGLHDGYLVVGDELANVDPDQWDTTAMRRHIRPTSRCMLEVY
jgi:ferredoxin--NADP+ reductase